ncbi:MAG: sialidase family protein [Thermoleophilaceae bacterium]
MPRRSTAWLSALGLLLALAPAGAAEAREVRVFAMQPRLGIGWLESRESYREKLFGLMEREAEPHLRGPDDPARPPETARDLVLWPESVGLFAALTGERAQLARAAGSLEASIVTLIAAYAPQEAYYAARFPELATRIVQTRLLATALTDTFGRTVIEPFAEMADRHDVYLHAGVDMVREWRIVCADRDTFQPPPGAERCDEEDPARVALLRDPSEPSRDYAYEAVRGDPSVMALVFDPDGRLISKQVKTYLTPTELGPDEGSLGLDLVPGEVSDGLGAVETPVGTLGFVTSKDAWMPDVVQKLDQRHVDLLVQPEFFVGSLVSTSGLWYPDLLKASGYSDLVRHPSFEALALPEMTGGVFSFYADHQSHVAVKPRTGREEGGSLVGQPSAPGLQSSPWVVPDPLHPGEPFDERRRRLGLAGEALAPGSGVECEGDPPGPCEDGHVEGVFFRDVEVARSRPRRRWRGRRTRTRFTPSRAASPSPHPQRNAAVARRGRHAVLAFEERTGGGDQIFLVRSDDGGRTWSERVRPTGRPAGATDEWWPAVALAPDGTVTVAWVDRSSGRERVYLSRSADFGAGFGPAAPLDPGPAAGVAQWKPALAQGAGDVVQAVFVDERDRHPNGSPQAGVFHARIAAGEPEPARRLDGGEPAPPAANLDNAWAPSVEARGSRVLVAWTDFLNYDWDVFARASGDGGDSFGAADQVNDAQGEGFGDSPQAVLGAGRPFVAFTDFGPGEESQRRPHPMYDVYVASPGAEGVHQADPHGARHASAFAGAACAAARDDVLVAFQDAASGQNDIRIARLADGERRGPAYRVDDAGRGGGNAWRPRLACSRGGVLAAWEDERDGPQQVYAAVARSRRLR